MVDRQAKKPIVDVEFAGGTTLSLQLLSTAEACVGQLNILESFFFFWVTYIKPCSPVLLSTVPTFSEVGEPEFIKSRLYYVNYYDAYLD